MTDTNPAGIPPGVFYDEILVLDENGETTPIDWSAQRPHGAATPESLAAFETELYARNRRHRDAPTPYDDALPADALADDDATRSALSRLPRA